MSKFFIKCPNCGKYHEASTGLFAHRHIDCDCGYCIHVKTDRMSSIKCPKCSNSVVYDQAHRDNIECPVCHSHLDPFKGSNETTIHCPTCNLSINVDKDSKSYTCPVCDSLIDVQKQIAKEKASNSNQISVIKYEGPSDVICYKYPIEDFLTGSILMVHESQQAIFLKDGEALDTFGPGRHVLTTNRLPIIGKYYNLDSNQNAQPFHCEVYFVNMSSIMGIKWGTPNKVGLFDPHSGLHVDLGACGTFNLSVKEPRKLLFKLVGTSNGLFKDDIIGEKDFAGMFKDLVISKVKSNLAKTIKSNDINILEVDEHIDEISQFLKNEINPTMEEYGLTINEFFVTNILLPNDDPNFRKMKEQYAEQYLKVRNENILKDEAIARQQRRMVEVQTEANEEVMRAQAKATAYKLQAEAEAQEMKMKGYTYQQETQRQVAVGAVNNPGVGNIGNVSSTASTMIDLGIGLGMMKEVVHTVGDTLKPAMDVGKDIASNVNQTTETKTQTSTWECPNCHTKDISSKFCPECGTKKPDEEWTCPDCKTEHIKSKFCPNCGHKREA